MSNSKTSSLTGSASSNPSRFQNINLNSSLKTNQSSNSGSRGFAVMHGDRNKSGKLLSSTSSVVAPLPMNVPSQRKDSRIMPQSTTTAQPWGQSGTENSKSEELSSTSATTIPGSKMAPWAKTNDSSASTDAPTSRLASSRNWAEMDSDEEEDNNGPDLSRTITINRDEVIDDPSFQNSSNNWRTSHVPTNRSGLADDSNSFSGRYSTDNSRFFDNSRSGNDYRRNYDRDHLQGMGQQGFGQHHRNFHSRDNQSIDSSRAYPSSRYPPNQSGHVIGHLRSNLDIRDNNQRDDGRFSLGTNSELQDQSLGALEEARLERELLERKKMQGNIHSHSTLQRNSGYPSERDGDSYNTYDRHRFDDREYGRESSIDHDYNHQGESRYRSHSKQYSNSRYSDTFGSRENSGERSGSFDEGYRRNDREYRDDDDKPWERHKKPLSSDNSKRSGPYDSNVVPRPHPTLLSRGTKLQSSHGTSQPSSETVHSDLTGQHTSNANSNLENQLSQENNAEHTQSPNKTFASLFPRSAPSNDSKEEITSTIESHTIFDRTTTNNQNHSEIVDELNERGVESNDAPRRKMLYDVKTHRMVPAEGITKNNSTSVAPRKKTINNRDGPSFYKSKNEDTTANAPQVVSDDNCIEKSQESVDKPWKRNVASSVSEEQTQVNEEIDNTNSFAGKKDKDKDSLRAAKREARQQEKIARGPRTSGVLYRFAEDGSLEQILSEDEAKALAAAQHSKKQRLPVYDIDGNLSKPGSRRDIHGSGVRKGHHSDYENSRYESEGIASQLSSWLNAPQSNDVGESTIHEAISSLSGAEVAVDLTSYDLDIQNLAAEADAKRSEGRISFQTFLPGYGLKADVAHSSPIRDKGRIGASAIKNNSSTVESNRVDEVEGGDAFGLDDFSHIESIMRSVEIDDTALDNPFPSNVYGSQNWSSENGNIYNSTNTPSESVPEYNASKFSEHVSDFKATNESNFQSDSTNDDSKLENVSFKKTNKKFNPTSRGSGRGQEGGRRGGRGGRGSGRGYSQGRESVDSNSSLPNPESIDSQNINPDAVEAQTKVPRQVRPVSRKFDSQNPAEDGSEHAGYGGRGSGRGERGRGRGRGGRGPPRVGPPKEKERPSVSDVAQSTNPTPFNSE